jgi:hypothetical protein
VNAEDALMQEFVDDRVEQRALLGHVALCFVVAGALGFLGGGFAGAVHFAHPSTVIRYLMVSVCVTTSFVFFFGVRRTVRAAGGRSSFRAGLPKAYLEVLPGSSSSAAPPRC